MPYRVDPKTGMIECDGAEEALALASMITDNGTKKAARRQVSQESLATLDVRSFVRGLKENAKKILAYMIQDNSDAITLESLKQALGTEDGKTVGGTITSITRKARGLGIGDVIIKDATSGIYRIASAFKEAFERAGKPKIQ